MWAIRVLTGQQAGQIFPLKAGANVLGRAPSCDIKILSPNVSKEHVKIDVLEGKFIVSDMGSRNGTFLNGTQVRSSRLKPGDRIGMHDVMIELVPMQARAPEPVHGNLAYQMQPAMNHPPQIQGHAQPHGLGHLEPQRPPQVATMAQEYVDRVVLPGVYRLAEMMEFKWLLGLFMAAFILLVTSLSTIPLIRILRDSVEEQSQQHALTIAATLAKVNEAAIRDGLYTAINMTTANRVGVEAMIIQALDGKIIAPSSRAESYPDIPFVHEARKLPRESVQQVDGNTVVAVHPIEAYNAETGSRGTLAYSVVVYDMGTLAVDDSKTISLFVITLFIASILGALLFFFLYKLIEYPLVSLNMQLDKALREGRDDLKTTFDFEPLARLTKNINSALTRVLTGGSAAEQPRAIEHDRRLEMQNLVEMVGFAAMVVSAVDRAIAHVNQGFEARTRIDTSRLLNQPVVNVTDQSLKLSLLDLMDRLDQNPDQLVTNELEFGGENFQIIAQAVYGTSKIAYYLIILVPAGGEG